MTSLIEQIKSHVTEEKIQEASQKTIEFVERQLRLGWFTWDRYYETWFYTVRVPLVPFDDRIIEEYFHKKGLHCNIVRNLNNETIFEINFREMSPEEKKLYGVEE